MIGYYEDKMNHSHKQWMKAVEDVKPIAAKAHQEDYLNYKSMYDSRAKATGQEVESI
jgi:hypothetical protein